MARRFQLSPLLECMYQHNYKEKQAWSILSFVIELALKLLSPRL